MLIHCLSEHDGGSTGLNIVKVYNKQKDGHTLASKNDICMTLSFFTQFSRAQYTVVVYNAII